MNMRKLFVILMALMALTLFTAACGGGGGGGGGAAAETPNLDPGIPDQVQPVTVELITRPEGDFTQYPPIEVWAERSETGLRTVQVALNAGVPTPADDDPSMIYARKLLEGPDVYFTVLPWGETKFHLAYPWPGLTEKFSYIVEGAEGVGDEMAKALRQEGLPAVFQETNLPEGPEWVKIYSPKNGQGSWTGIGFKLEIARPLGEVSAIQVKTFAAIIAAIDATFFKDGGLSRLTSFVSVPGNLSPPPFIVDQLNFFIREQVTNNIPSEFDDGNTVTVSLIFTGGEWRVKETYWGNLAPLAADASPNHPIVWYSNYLANHLPTSSGVEGEVRETRAFPYEYQAGGLFWLPILVKGSAVNISLLANIWQYSTGYQYEVDETMGDVVEFSCPDSKWGIVVYMPLPEFATFTPEDQVPGFLLDDSAGLFEHRAANTIFFLVDQEKIAKLASASGVEY